MQLNQDAVPRYLLLYVFHANLLRARGWYAPPTRALSLLVRNSAAHASHMSYSATVAFARRTAL